MGIFSDGLMGDCHPLRRQHLLTEAHEDDLLLPDSRSNCSEMALLSRSLTACCGHPWLNDHESDVFFVGTCNDASKLPPEFARAERFDGVFFVDLPGRDQKDAIWGIYTRHYGLDAKQARPDDTNWTGAEIKSCCRLASLLDVPLVQPAQNVVPVAVTAGDKIEGLRQWASGRCLSADRAGVYSRAEGGSGGRVRRVVRAV